MGVGEETVWGWLERLEGRGGNGLRGMGGNRLGGGGWGGGWGMEGSAWGVRDADEGWRERVGEVRYNSVRFVFVRNGLPGLRARRES